MLDLREFGERIVGGKYAKINDFSGIELRKFLIFRIFLSFPYTISTSYPLDGETLRLLKGRYHRGEVSLTYPHPDANVSLPSPTVRRGRRYHRERRRLIRRAEERGETLRDVPFETFYALYKGTVGRYGRKPIPADRLKAVYSLRGVEVFGFRVGGEDVGVIMNLALPDRYLLWQMGWLKYNFVPTYLLHIGIERGFSLGYDVVDLGISPSPGSLKLKAEMGGDVGRRVYVIRWRRV